MVAPRILTFNFHEPYLCLMAETGLPLIVGEYQEGPLARTWQTRFRPIPKNITLVREHVWREKLEKGDFDVVVAQNETNAIDVVKHNKRKVPALLVCHNRRSFLRTTIREDRENGLELFDKLLERLQQAFEFIFISESKRDDYGVPGRVIRPGIDVEAYGGYTGRIPEVLRVGNAMCARDLMFDVDFQEAVCRGIPNRVFGDDPAIPGARMSASFENLLDTYRDLRCLLHVTREAWEDGYNLAMLEAMACGMPVVSLANLTSPLTDGRDGFVSYDADVLRARIEALLDDHDLARGIGARGRETVAAKFPLRAFVDSWREVLETAAERSPRRTEPAGPPAVPRLNILLDYVASPLTTGRYLERAARKRHRVVTAGLRAPEAVLANWGFPEPVPGYLPHEIDLPLHATYREILARLPRGL